MEKKKLKKIKTGCGGQVSNGFGRQQRGKKKHQIFGILGLSGVGNTTLAKINLQYEESYCSRLYILL